jgi:hypothetical protein
MNVYGTPRACIPLGVAATAASMTRAALLAALGTKAIIVAPNKIGVTAADLDAISPGASAGLAAHRAPHINAAGRDNTQW